MRRALYRDQVVRLSVRSLRSQFKPSVFRTLNAVTLAGSGGPVRVSLVRVPERTCFSGERVFLVCPHCNNQRVNVLGWDGARWGCMRCLKWRGRNCVNLMTWTPKQAGTEARLFTA
jgi:hypothetical protein